MNCNTFHACFDDYLDGELAIAEHEAAQRHLNDCESCRRRVGLEQQMRHALRELPVAPARPGFYARALNEAKRPAVRFSRRMTMTVGAALAASVIAWLGADLLPGFSARTPQLADVTIALYEPRPVQLMFNAENPLKQATLAIQLPDGVEVQGYPGQRELSWHTDLEPGANLLTLPLVAVGKRGGTLTARLEHDGRSKELSMNLSVRDPAHSGARERDCLRNESCGKLAKELNHARV